MKTALSVLTLMLTMPGFSVLLPMTHKNGPNANCCR